MRNKNKFKGLNFINNIARITALFVCFLISLAVGTVSASPYVTLDERDKIEIVEENLWYKTSPLISDPRFTDLVLLYADAKQVTSTLGGNGAFVARIPLANSRDIQHTRFVNLYTNYLDIGTAYWQSEQGEVVALASFGQITGTNPKLAHSQTFSLMLSQQERGVLWIFIQAKKFATPVDVNIYSKAAFYNKQFITNSINTMAFSVMITLALIACFIYFRTRYLVTLACAGYVGFHGLGWLVASGSFGQLFSVSAFNPVYIGIMIFPFAIASASQFTKLLFNCPQEHSKFAKLFNLLSIVSVTLGLLMPFLSFNNSFLISHIIAAVWIPISIGTGIFMLTTLDFKAKYYLIGNLLYGLSLFAYVLSHALKLDWNISTELIVQVALTIDCICILLSLTEWLQIKQKDYHRSYTISRIDPLTKIGNRYAQNEKLAKLTGGYCLTFIDLDGFKEINDTFGHDEGDKLLISTVDLIQQKLQGLGTIFRSGGDEFILVAEITNLQQTASVISQLSVALLKTEQELQRTRWKNIGLSFGIATSFETANQSECLSLADQRMYKHKQEKKKDKPLIPNITISQC
ncbi:MULTISPECIES: diguanylate cyclase [unclassified Shewanella]|uniref:diguanylate cyclase n=1 Tax=unclassified Shewanella TaxID=196818 RepID=UPI000C838CF0|nr:MULTISPECIES: diguanylate cyclase [unclassified Shewanella]PMG30510.1 diguanylate cyclase [Shewanella sp. 10N.286.52.C2]PMH86130.1 diguanylate cyclase [Shewanella sp. 10N.286.48.B5]PMH98237.1 diguanylate cyclase [Shewanella sp. 10N.286.48.A6]